MGTPGLECTDALCTGLPCGEFHGMDALMLC